MGSGTQLSEAQGRFELRFSAAPASMWPTFFGEQGLGIAWDFSHYYESIDVGDLVDRALELEYEPIELLLALQASAGPRFLLRKATIAAPGDG